MKKKLIAIIFSIVLVFSMAGTCFAWTDGNGNHTSTWYMTWRNTTNMRYYWNVGTNIIISNQNAGLVCCDFGYNPNSNNDFVYSYCLDKQERHVSRMKQEWRGDDWFYARTSAGNTYTTNRADSYQTYGTSLVKRSSMGGGIVRYGVMWDTSYTMLRFDSFYF